MDNVSDNTIRELWHNPKIGYKGIKTFQILLKTDFNIEVSQQRLYKILKEDPLYLIHLPPKRDFERRSYDLKFPGELIQMDLAEMFNFDNFKFFLVVTDCFSSKVWTKNLKNKSSNNVCSALKDIIESIPFSVQEIESDRGTEFLGSPVQNYLKEKKIYYAMKFGKNKANFVENKIRIIKRLLYLSLRDKLTENWPELLPVVVESYNNTPLRHLGYLRPNDINTEIDSLKVKDAQIKNHIEVYSEPSYKEQQKNQTDYSKQTSVLKIGDFVYAIQNEKLFDKSYNIKLQESNTFPAQVYAQSFFAKLPSDQRFLSTTLHQFNPSSTLDGNTIEFNLEKFTGGNIIMIQDSFLFVTCKIVKSDGKTLPAKEKKVGCTNNLLHSLFSQVRLYLNNVQITQSPSLYPYKSYISTILTYSSECRNSHVSVSGFSDDMSGHMNASPANMGWEERVGYFKRPNVERNNQTIYGEYYPQGYSVMGKLQHELHNIDSGLPSDIKVKFELDKSQDSFVIMRPSDDVEQYKMLITNIILYVPIALLSTPLYKELSTLQANEKEPCVLHYRRLEVRPLTIVKDKIEWVSDSLYPESDLPCKIIFVFVKTVNKNGSYDSNPFDFQRKWPVTARGVQQNEAISGELLERLNNLEKITKRYSQIIEKFNLFQNSYVEKDTPLKPKRMKKDTKQAPKRTKRSLSPSIEQRVREESQRRLLEFLDQQSNTNEPTQSTSRGPPSLDSDFRSARSHTSDDLLPDDISSIGGVQEETTYCFIKNIELTLNSSPIDQLNFTSNENECLEAYFKMFYFNGQMNSLFSNNISYNDFKNGYFFSVWDLSTSSRCNSAYTVPTVRIGHLRLKVTFSESLPTDLTCLMYSEFPTSLYIYNNGKIGTSYTPR